MPSVTSLQKQQYYGHPRNVFWRIMAALFNDTLPLDYQEGQQLLESKKIAVWDVLKSCFRQGSLDSSIDKNTLEANDFIRFFSMFDQIKWVFFNGGMAELLYQKNVYPLLSTDFRALNYARLPSTSPAYAAISYEDKLVAWTVLKTLL